MVYELASRRRQKSLAVLLHVAVKAVQGPVHHLPGVVVVEVIVVCFVLNVGYLIVELVDLLLGFLV